MKYFSYILKTYKKRKVFILLALRFLLKKKFTKCLRNKYNALYLMQN